MKSWMRHIAILAALAVVLSPLFFIIDRVMVFDAVPHDDYAPFLLWLIGAPGGVFPASPYGYRILTMLAALPFYYGLPAFRLTNLPASLDPHYLQATAAIAALSYLSLLGSGLLAYRTARDRADLARCCSTFAGIILCTLTLYSQIFGIDSFAILLVAAGVFLLSRPVGFTAVIAASVFANEKVAIVFAIWLTLRCVCSTADRALFRAQLIATYGAIIVYGLALLVLHLRGNDYQLEPGGYLGTVMSNLRASVSIRGLLLNVLAVAVLLAVGGAGWRYAGRARIAMFRPLDLLVVPGLVLVAMTLTQMFQTGRIVMHAAPLFVLPAAVAIGRWMDVKSPPSVRPDA